MFNELCHSTKHKVHARYKRTWQEHVNPCRSFGANICACRVESRMLAQGVGLQTVMELGTLNA
jgi:hypothetical protein